MEHDIAIRTRAVERYLLGEMKPEERDAFEEHYFSCPSCAEDVRTTSMFVDNAKALLRQAPEPWHFRPTERANSSKRSWLAWLRPQAAFPALAAACLAVVVMYQNTVVIPGLRIGYAGGAIVLHEATRGDVPEIPQGRRLVLKIPLLGAVTAAVEVRSESGPAVPTITDLSADGEQNLFVSLPALKPGRYSVVIGGTSYPFRVR